MTAPATSADSTCEHCGTGLHRAPCGCWVDRDHTHWCNGERQHRPRDGSQPERCGGTP